MANINEIYVKVGLDTKDFDSSLQGIRREMAALKGKIGSSLISKEDNDILKARFGDIKGQFEDLQVAASAVDTGDVFGNMARGGAVAAQAVGGVIGTMNLLGLSTKKAGELEKQLLTAISIGNALQAVADAKRLKSLAVAYAAKFKELILFKQSNVVAAESAILAGKDATAKGVQAVSTGLLTKAQLAFNAAVRANPLGVFLTVLAAVVAGITLLVGWLNKANSASADAYEEMNALIEKQKEWNDLLKDTNKTLQDSATEYKVAMGIITQADADRTAVNQKYAEMRNALRQSELEFQLEVDKLENLSDEDKQNLKLQRHKLVNTLLINIDTANANEIAVIDKKEIDDKKKKDEEIAKSAKQTAEQRLKTEQELAQKVADIYLASKKALTDLVQSINTSRNTLSGLLLDKESLKYEQYQFNKYTEAIEDSVNKLKVSLINLRSEPITDTSEFKNEVDAYKSFFNNLETIEKNYNERILNLIITRRNVTLAMAEDTKNTTISSLEIERDEKLRVYQKQIDDNIKFINENKLLTKKEKDDLLQANKNYEESKNKTTELYGIQLKNIELKYVNDIADINKKADQDILDSKTNLYQRLLNFNLGLANAQRQLVEIEKSSFKVIIENDKILYQEKTVQDRLDSKEKIIKSLQQEAIYQKDVYDAQIKLNEATLTGTELVNANTEALNNFKLALQQIQEEIKTIETEKPLSNFTKGWDIKVIGEDFKKNWIQYMTELANITGQLMTSAIDSFIQQSQNAMEIALEQMDQLATQEKDNLNTLLEEQLITRKQYEDKVAEIDRKKSEQEKKLKRDQFQKEKQANILKAIISGAVAVVQAYASAGNPILGAVFAALTAALVATQIGLIAKQPVPEFGEGGQIEGKSHSEGGVPVIAEGGEFIVRKSVVERPGMLERLYTINNQGLLPHYATGGLVTNNRSMASSTVNNTYNQLNEESIRTIVGQVVNGMASIPVVNVETDYTKVQRKVQNIESRSTW